MQISLEYGRTGLPVQLPTANVTKVLTYRDVEPLSDPGATLRRQLDQPTGSPPLADLAQGRSNACILICDITRPVPNQLILRPMLETLESAGIAREDILILVATGLHRGNDKAELREMVGEEIASQYRIENHDGLAAEQHSYLGESPNGVPIWIDSRYVDADFKLSVGLIEPHFMAGFSGGRKLICPGIAGLETVKAWHSPKFLEHPLADTGVLAGNPVHLENTWIAKRAGCDFIVNVVLDSYRRPIRFVVGDMEQAFLEGCEFVSGMVTDTVPAPVDIVVTSSAGYPLDTTFYQSVKGMVAALPILKEGGTIILAASMSEGIGSAPFAGLFEQHASLDDFMQAILRDDYFVMDQWQLEKMARVCRNAEVLVVSEGLPPETLDRLFVRHASSVEAAVECALQQHGSHAQIAVIPKGPYVVGRVA